MYNYYCILFVLLYNYIPNSLVKVSFESGCPSKCIWIKRQSSTRGARCPKPWVADQPRQPSRWELRDKVSIQMTSVLRGGPRSFPSNIADLELYPHWFENRIQTEFVLSSCFGKGSAPCKLCVGFKFYDRMDGQCGDCHWVLGAFRGISLIHLHFLCSLGR